MKILSVVSGKGGTGKSCIAAYAGAALSKAGKKTLLVELGSGFRSLDLILGLPETALFHIGDLASGVCGIDSAMVQVPGHEGLFLISAGYTVSSPLSGEDFSRVAKAFPSDLDYLILDGADASSFPARLVDSFLMVTTPDSLSVRAAAALSRHLRKSGAKDIRLVINQVPVTIPPIKGISDFDDLIDIVEARLIAVLPASPKLAYAANNTEPLDGDSLVPQIFDRMAQRILGKSSPLLVR